VISSYVHLQTGTGCPWLTVQDSMNAPSVSDEKPLLLVEHATPSNAHNARTT
jgi:hypothetical protein